MKAVRHTGIVTSDLDRSLIFYRDLLGLKICKKTEEPAGFISKICGLKDPLLTTVKMAADDGSLIELLQFRTTMGLKKSAGLQDVGASHVAFTVSDLDKEYKRLTESGVEFVSAPQMSPEGSAKVAFCKDPDGVFIELVEVTEER